jgi:hypothetical protein
VCWIYGWTRRLTVPAVLALMHIGGEAQVIPWLVHRMLYYRLYNLVWTSFALRTLASKLNCEATMGSLVYSILSPEWNADKTRVDKVRY